MASGHYGAYSTTSHASQGGAGGGGFIPGESSQVPANASRGYSRDTLRPVTLKQINDAKLLHAECSIDGTEVSQIVFVGQIRHITEEALSITFKFDDGTGTTNVKYWINESTPDLLRNPDGSKTGLAEGAYARVFAKLKIAREQAQAVAHAVRPIRDYNEISHHLLEATAVHLYFTKGPPVDGEKQPAKTGDVQMSGYGDGGQAPSNVSAEAKRILQVLRTTPQGHEGLHMTTIEQRTGMDLAAVARAGDELLTLGMIYTTVDDTTWALLEV